MTTQKDKHTPGPWQEFGPYPCQIYGGDPKRRIAVIDRTTGQPNEQHDADARLIAAAPLMLVELRETLRDLSEWDGTKEALQIIRANLTAAIDKATKV